jgi:seryl-tRNA synthetase
MWPPDEIVRVLRERGELSEPAPGVVTLRGEVARLMCALEQAIGTLCSTESPDEWRVPPAIAFPTLARADYFASFPQWLTLVSHLSDDEAALRVVAEHNEPSGASVTAPKAALNPAVCYHVYSGLAGQVIDAPRLITAQSTCWRHEGARHAPLARQWAFTMREIVFVGAAADAQRFLDRAGSHVIHLARALGLDPSVAVASDPFFAPTARGKQLLQQIEELKREMLLPIGTDDCIAASSFNLHGTFFGQAFDIRLPTGAPASTACVAFGLERWLLAFLVRHGLDAAAWPAVDSLLEALHA